MRLWRGLSVLRQPLPRGRYRYVRRRWRALFTVVDAVGESLVAWRAKIARGRHSRSAGVVRSILLVQLDHLGDALLTTAVLPDLRRRFPEARIDVLGTPWNREVFEAAPEIDRVHLSRWNRFAGGWRPGWFLATLAWGWRLRRRYDLAIDVRGEFPQAALIWLSGAPRRVGWDCGGGGFLLTDRAAFVPGRAEIESRLALLALLGVQPSQRLLQKRRWFDPGSDARARMSLRLQALDASVIVLHIGGGSPAKRWPAAHWQELLGRIRVECGGSIVLIGSASEQPLAGAITGDRDWPGVANWTGLLSLRETAALLEHAQLLIGPDSGPAHLAAAVGTPAIVLFSGTNRVPQWRPWGRRVWVMRDEVDCSPCHRRKCPLAGHPCMTGLTPERVMRQVRRVFAVAALSKCKPKQALPDVDAPIRHRHAVAELLAVSDP
ncbi:MAG TPA: glycosyltransferase family 9 protein [Pirellulales bacterium]|nr:glycosyltransferase family 9 protein [Pirellulales bacterium]